MNPKNTTSFMPNFETKLDALKVDLDNANCMIATYSLVANRIKTEIKALEEANTPKQGDIYKNVYRSTKYIVASVGPESYCLINLTTGERYSDPVPSILNIFGRNDTKNLLKEFVKVSR